MLDSDWPAGRRIVEVRELSAAEIAREGWEAWAHHGPVIALVLDDGGVLYPGRDGEGGGPGVLFAATPDGQSVAVAIGLQE